MSLLFPISRLGRNNARYNSYDLFNLFDDVFEGTGTSRKTSYTGNTPRANIVKDIDTYTIEMAAPGFSREEFTLSVENGKLTIELGTEDSKEYNDRLVHCEFTRSSFKRSFSLPENTRVDEIVARYEAGILYVDVPTEEKSVQHRQIFVD